MPAEQDKMNNQSTGSTGDKGATGGQQISGEQIFSTTEQGKGESFATTGSGSQSTGGAGAATGTATGSTLGGESKGNTGGNEKTEQLSNAVSEALRGNTTEITNTAKDAINTAKEAVGSVASQARGLVAEKASTAIDTQKGTIAQGLTSVVDGIRAMGESLGAAEPQTPIAKYTAHYGNTLADQVERIAGYLDRQDVNGLMQDTKEFARRNPTVFIGGAFVLGLIAARFIKSSPRQELMRREDNQEILHGNPPPLGKTLPSLDADTGTGSSAGATGTTGTTGTTGGATTGTTGSTGGAGMSGTTGSGGSRPSVG